MPQSRSRNQQNGVSTLAIAQRLREDIVTGRLRSGDRVKEVPMALSIGVSRGRVREAIRLVAEEGLLEIQPNKGASVPLPSVFDVLEVYALRASLGSLALRRLAMAPERLDLRKLQICLATFAEAVNLNDEDAAVWADLHFQDEIIRQSGLPRVCRTFKQLSNLIAMFIASLGVTYDLQSIYADVDNVYTALATGDLEEADRLWREKFERCMLDFSDYVRESHIDSSLWLALTRGI